MRYLPVVVVCLAALMGGESALAQKAKRPAKASTVSADKKIYCWDEAGTRVCGDALPTSAINSARTEINAKTGFTSKQIPRALTPEEQALADIEAQRQAAEGVRQAERARLGLALLGAYPDEAALMATFAERKKRSQQDVKAAQEALATLRKTHLDRLEDASTLELNGKPVNKKQKKKILKGRERIGLQVIALGQQQATLAKMDGLRDESLAIYREAVARAHPNKTLTATAPEQAPLPQASVPPTTTSTGTKPAVK